MTMDSPRKRASSSVGLDLIPLRCHCGGSLRSDNSRRPRGTSLVDPSLMHTSSRWASPQSWNSRTPEVGKIGKTHHYRKVQARVNTSVCGLAAPVKSLCCRTSSKFGGNRRAITKNIEKPTAPTLMETPISDTVRPLVSRVRWVAPPLTPTCARHPSSRSRRRLSRATRALQAQ